MFNFRAIARSLGPSWLLSEGHGERVAYTISVLLDAFMQRAKEGLEARFPSRTSPSGQALIGQDRGILKGKTETYEHYAARLKRWRWPRGHRVRGNAFALLEQIAEYFGGMRCYTIDPKGTIDLREFDGTESTSYDNEWDWDGTPATPNWARFWIVLDPAPDHPEIIPWPTLGDGAWGSLDPQVNRLKCLGHQGITPDDARAIKGLLRGRIQWRPGGTRKEWVIVALEPTSGGGPVPDGEWATYQGRSAAFRYWNLRTF